MGPIEDQRNEYKLSFEVRDYECDLQGIVNNANYMHYLEHARHRYLKDAGVDFSELHIRGIDPIVVRAELDYKVPLSSGDLFAVSVAVVPDGRMKTVFEQQIVRIDGTIIMNAKIFAAVLVSGRPTPFEKAFTAEEYARLLGHYPS